jgi:hypothetical protein
MGLLWQGTSLTELCSCLQCSSLGSVQRVYLRLILDTSRGWLLGKCVISTHWDTRENRSEESSDAPVSESAK